MIDFTNSMKKNKAYAGANGGKIAIVYNGEQYMLKFPPYPTKNKDADIIIKGIENYDFNMNEIDKPYLFEREISNPKLILCESFANDLWKMSYNTMYERLPNYIYSFTPGDELVFDFEGSFLGIYYTVEKDSGIIEYCIDNDEWKECSLWDKYALHFGRAHFLILEEGLESRLHTVKIRNSHKKDEKSEGHYVRLGAFAVV